MRLLTNACEHVLDRRTWGILWLMYRTDRFPSWSSRCLSLTSCAQMNPVQRLWVTWDCFNSVWADLSQPLISHAVSHKFIEKHIDLKVQDFTAKKKQHKKCLIHQSSLVTEINKLGLYPHKVSPLKCMLLGGSPSKDNGCLKYLKHTAVHNRGLKKEEQQ